MYNEGVNVSWKRYIVTTEDGYELTLAHIYGTSSGTVSYDSLAPVLLWHGEFGSGEDWLDSATATISAFPTRLFNDSYDVWIGWRRGTTPSRDHIDPTFNADYNDADGTAASNYWNFSTTDVGRYDLPAVIQEISQVREDDTNYFCDKMQILTYSGGAQDVAAFLSLYPTDSAKIIKAHVAIAPCVIPNLTYINDLFAAVSRRRLQSTASIQQYLKEYNMALRRAARTLGSYSLFR
jgi:hypothetical protein